MKRETQAKENMKKKQKKSKVKRFFRTLFVLILLAGVGVGGYYGARFALVYHEHSQAEQEYDPLSATALGIDPEKLATIGRLNMLVLGESGVGDGYKLTDSIMIVSYNPQTQQASILSVPRDTYVGKKDKNSASANYLASYKMNAVYRNGENIPETIECVNNLTGLSLENYVLVDTNAIIEVVDAIGGVWFDVPIDMDYDDDTQDLHIHLTAGEQLINGEKAEQLLRFRHNNDYTSYPMEYGDNDLGRMRTQREFIQETAKQLLKLENVTKVLSLMDIAYNNVKTNIDFETLKYYIPYVFKFNTENIQSDVVPGVSEKCNGIWIYSANKTQTKQVVEDLFTDKVYLEEQTEEENENIISGNETSSEIKKEDTTSDSTTKQEENKITIELLNGTGDSQILSDVRNKLKDAGYDVIKSGETSSTAKTTIINRRNQPSIIGKDIKEKLGLGAITSGSDNSKVDFTIIIGKDYE